MFTSNVDGQFQKAGFDSNKIHECHGSIHHLQCSRSCTADHWPADQFEPDVDDDACRLRNQYPVCPRCGELARPNVLMFGDWGWVSKRADQQRKRETAWLKESVQHRARVVVVEIGAGTAVPSVRNFSHRLIQTLDARLVRINVREFEVPSSRDVGLGVGALDALGDIGRNLDNQPTSPDRRN